MIIDYINQSAIGQPKELYHFHYESKVKHMAKRKEGD